MNKTSAFYEVRDESEKSHAGNWLIERVKSAAPVAKKVPLAENIFSAIKIERSQLAVHACIFQSSSNWTLLGNEECRTFDHFQLLSTCAAF